MWDSTGKSEPGCVEHLFLEMTNFLSSILGPTQVVKEGTILSGQCGMAGLLMMLTWCEGSSMQVLHVHCHCVTCHSASK